VEVSALVGSMSPSLLTWVLRSNGGGDSCGRSVWSHGDSGALVLAHFLLSCSVS
jgi:hypothetical protein